MKSSTFVLWVVALGVALPASTQQPARAPSFSDRAGTFALENLREFVSEGLPGKPQKFRAGGSPLTGYSRKQGLEFRANQVEGTAEPFGSGSLALKQATATGNVQLVIERAEQGSEGRYQIDSQKLTFAEDANSATATLPGALTFVGSSAAQGVRRTWTLKGSSGTFALAPLRSSPRDPLRSAKIEGPVDVDLTSEATKPEGKETLRIVGKANQLTYDAGKRELTLSGAVDYEGTLTPAGGGEPDVYRSQVDRMVVTFSETFEITNVRLEGSPGRASLQQGDPQGNPR